MKRHIQKTRADWNPIEENVNTRKCWKFNKNVTEREKKMYRASMFRQNVSLVADS